MKKSLISHIRTFNRFYTHLIGVLDEGYLATAYSLTEARILFEIAAVSNTAEIIEALRIDKGYLSRVLKKFEKDDLIIKTKSLRDARASQIALTKKGKLELDTLNAQADQQLEVMIANLSSKQQKQLVNHMSSVMEILGQNATEREQSITF